MITKLAVTSVKVLDQDEALDLYLNKWVLSRLRTSGRVPSAG
jgi:hypothetical protein